MRIRSLLVALAGLLVLGFIGLWIATPTAADVQPRVARLVASEHSRLLRPGEVPPLLKEAVVGIEYERFFQHHGLDVVGLVRSGLYDAGHGCLCQGGSEFLVCRSTRSSPASSSRRPSATRWYTLTSRRDGEPRS